MKVPLAVLLLAAIPFFSPGKTTMLLSIPDLVEKVEQSVVVVAQSWPDESHLPYICGGFVVDAAKGLVVTAQHCVELDEDDKAQYGDPILTVDGLDTEVRKVGKSLALLQIQSMWKPPLEIRKDEPRKGEELIAVGMGLGNHSIEIRHVMTILSHSVALDDALAHGMSGGPVVDREGKVVGVAQMSSPIEDVALISQVKDIREISK